MADLRIVDAPDLPLEELTEEVKIPTGGKGNYAVKAGDVATFVESSKDLANKTFVNSSSNGVKALLDAHKNDKANPHGVTKFQVGLGNVDNTADLDKPVGNATSAAIIAATQGKADKTYVDTQDALKANKADLGTASEYNFEDLPVNQNQRDAFVGFVKTVADLNTIQNPKNGQVVYVSSENLNYIYKDSIWVQNSDSTLVDLTYLKPPTDFDLTQILQSFVTLSSTKPIHLVLPHGSFKITKALVNMSSKGIVFDLNGGTLFVDKVSDTDYVLGGAGNYALNLQVEGGVNSGRSIVIKNGVLDGSRRAQNLFETKVVEDLTKGTNGIWAVATNVIFENLVVQHMYGQATKTFARNFSTNNVGLFDVGGRWWTSDGNDSFGDGFYIGTGGNTSGTISVSFNNTTSIGKYSRQYPENHQEGSPLVQDLYSRIGFTIERFGGTNRNEVLASFNNCNFQNYERGIHQELALINSKITLQSTVFNSCVMFGNYLSETMRVYAENCSLGFYGSEYQGSKGVVRNYQSTSTDVYLKKCIVTNLAGLSNSKMIGTGGVITLDNCEVIDLTDMWSESTTVSFINNCKLSVLEHANRTFFKYGGAYYFENTVVAYKGSSEAVKIYRDQTADVKVKNSTFEMFLPVVNTFADNFESATIVNKTATPLNVSDINGSRYKVVNSSGAIEKLPRFFWGLDNSVYMNKRYFWQTEGKPGAGTAISLATAGLVEAMKSVSIGYLIVKSTRANASGNSLYDLSQTVIGKGYYLIKVQRDATSPNGIKVLGVPTLVGDVTDHTLVINDQLSVGTYGSQVLYIHSVLIPQSEAHTIPFIPESLI